MIGWFFHFCLRLLAIACDSIFFLFSLVCKRSYVFDSDYVASENVLTKKLRKDDGKY